MELTMSAIPFMTAPSKTRRLPPAFYLRSPEVVAPDMLGKILIHHLHGELLTGRIVETEAYLGLNDPASHTAIGKTERNAVLFGPPGVAHVYFIYGMHYCMSISCRPESEPGGVLLRALLPISGLDTMARLRGLPNGAGAKQLTGGPENFVRHSVSPANSTMGSTSHCAIPLYRLWRMAIIPRRLRLHPESVSKKPPTGRSASS
jgi:DNA-3-methyladenine glycosylase